jgi:hypothetical protein
MAPFSGLEPHSLLRSLPAQSTYQSHQAHPSETSIRSSVGSISLTLAHFNSEADQSDGPQTSLSAESIRKHACIARTCAPTGSCSSNPPPLKGMELKKPSLSRGGLGGDGVAVNLKRCSRIQLPKRASANPLEPDISPFFAREESGHLAIRMALENLAPAALARSGRNIPGYASQPGPLPDHATLDSRRWPTFASAGPSPAGLLQGDFRS